MQGLSIAGVGVGEWPSPLSAPWRLCHKPPFPGQAIADTEGLVEKLRLAAEAAEEKLSLARLRLREQMQAGECRRALWGEPRPLPGFLGSHFSF